MLAFVLSSTNLADLNNGVPQCWDAYPPYGGAAPSLGSYRFDFYAAYAYAFVYAAICNDTAFLTTPLSAEAAEASPTGVDVLLALATSWMGFPASNVSPWLRDYGPDKRDYLEVVPTYVDVVSKGRKKVCLPAVYFFIVVVQVPALQFGSVGMSLAHARLLEALDGDASLAATLRANASAIFNDAVRFLWQSSDDGAWRCLYPEGNSTAVRSINDYVYISQVRWGSFVSRRHFQLFFLCVHYLPRQTRLLAFWGALMRPSLPFPPT